MLEEELILLVQKIVSEKCEKQHLEIKKASGGTPTRLYDTLSSFSNQSGGGIILFGMDEASNFEITGVYDPQDLQKKVMEQSLQMEPVVRPLFTVARIDDKTVVSAEISECELSEKPCFYKGTGRLRGSFTRVGESDLPMTEYEVYSYEAYKKRIHDELRTTERAKVQHLSMDLVHEYLIQLRRQKPNLMHVEDERVLETQGICINGVPTLAGLLLLGEYPQEFYPQLSITAMVIEGKSIGELSADGARFMDNKRIEGTISQMLEGAMAFVRRNMKSRTVITQEGRRSDRFEYPLVAIREIILNALIHRDYSAHTDRSPIRLMMFEDRLELENPGGLYGRLTIDDLGKVSADTRNPYIAGALEVMLNTENRFSGIPTIRLELKKAGLPAPEFLDQRGVFRVIFYNSNSDDQLGDAKGMESEILAFCRTPRTREELAMQFGFESVSYFISNFILPLVAEGKLGMSIPDKPKSKFQKYATLKY